MDSENSSFQISLDSTLESVDLGSISVDHINQEIQQIRPDNSNNECSLIDDVAHIYLKHPMSLECLTDWVKLLNSRLEDCEKLPPGKVQLLKLFRETYDLPDIFLFIKCSKCRKSTKVQSDEKHGLKCVHCDDILKTNETNYFVVLPVEKQIVESVKNNWSDICSFNTSGDDKKSKSYADAHDGKILYDVLKHYEDSDINVLSLCLNVDGANKFKSNTYSVWPIQLMQNFLPPHIRFLPKNIILNGLYYHKSTDNEQLSFHEYLRPLVEELKQLKQQPISMDIDDQHYKFKPIITHCAVDLPAKSKLQEMKQFGGYDACSFCEIPGEKIPIVKPKTDKKTSKKSDNENNTKAAEASMKPKYFVRYVGGDSSFKLRDEVETLEKMLTASKSEGKNFIDGIKDVSPLVGMEHFNIIWSISTEYMHGCLLGVEKRLLNLFLNSKYSNKDHYIGPFNRNLLSKRITNIRPTSSIVRKPRPLTQLSTFKASEHRSLLLYYLPVCLPGCIRHVYVKHLRLFSAAVYILLQKTITGEEVDRAEEMLVVFVRQHQELFGKENMVMVIHLAMHLAQCVRWLGPLWCHSAFPFERNNGCLLKLVVGTTDVLHQISTKYCLSKAVSYKHVTNAETHKKKNIDGPILLGTPVVVEESASQVFDANSLDIIHFKNEQLSVHKRIKCEKIVYTSMLYTLPKRSIDYFIGLKNGSIGTAKYYFSHDDRICVMLLEYEVIDSIDHIDKVSSTNRLILASVNEIEKKYIFMSVGLNKYIVCRPNPYENE